MLHPASKGGLSKLSVRPRPFAAHTSSGLFNTWNKIYALQASTLASAIMGLDPAGLQLHPDNLALFISGPLGG